MQVLLGYDFWWLPLCLVCQYQKMLNLIFLFLIQGKGVRNYSFCKENLIIEEDLVFVMILSVKLGVSSKSSFYIHILWSCWKWTSTLTFFFNYFGGVLPVKKNDYSASSKKKKYIGQINKFTNLLIWKKLFLFMNLESLEVWDLLKIKLEFRLKLILNLFYMENSTSPCETWHPL